MTLKAETLRALAEKATPGPWLGYSEPEVNLPYSLFAGSPMVSGFGPVEPLSAAEVDLIAMLRNAVPEILALLEADKNERVAALEAENVRMREALDWYAEQGADCRKITSEGEKARFALDKDGGSLARHALGKEHAS